MLCSNCRLYSNVVVIDVDIEWIVDIRAYKQIGHLTHIKTVSNFTEGLEVYIQHI